jgi:hypothetical protein
MRVPRAFAGEDGTVMVFVVALAMALLMVAGLMYDGGQILNTRREAFAVAMRHIGTEQDLPFTDELHDLRQKHVFHFGAEIKIPLLDIIHRRELLERRGARNQHHHSRLTGRF